MRSPSTRAVRWSTTVALAAAILVGQPLPTTSRQHSASNPEPLCSKVTLHFRCLRQPPVYHRGEVIRARLSLRTNGQLGFTALPEAKRGSYKEILIGEPQTGAIDPVTLDPRIRIGSTLGSGWSEDRTREIDVNEWIQFRRSGHYLIHAVLAHIVPLEITGKNSKPWLNCELTSNGESIDILPPDATWEHTELVRIDRLLSSEPTSFAAASALRYLNTPEAAVALVHWYLRLSGEPVNSELVTGIFESQYSNIVQTELEKALRSGSPFPEKAIDTLALLETRKQFGNLSRPRDPKAARAWSNDYWALFRSLKNTYSAAAAHSKPGIPSAPRLYR